MKGFQERGEEAGVGDASERPDCSSLKPQDNRVVLPKKSTPCSLNGRASSGARMSRAGTEPLPSRSF